MWVVSFITQLLYPWGKSPWYPLDRRLGGPQSRSGCSCKKKYPCGCWESNSSHSIYSLVTIWSELPQFFLKYFSILQNNLVIITSPVQWRLLQRGFRSLCNMLKHSLSEYVNLCTFVLLVWFYIPVPAKFVPEISNDVRWGRLSTSNANVWFSFLKVPCFSFDCEISRCLLAIIKLY
jgi:hypothetical protein